MKKPERFTKKLLVEGNDDQHVIWALCEKFRVRENFDVIDCGGIEQLLTQIPVRYKQSNVEIVGIIIDADVNINSRWDSLKDILTSLGFTIPNEIPIDGFIAKNIENKTVGVWIMPNNQLNGMLEDFISFLVPKDDKLMPIVDSTLENLESNNLNRYSLTHKSKVKIHTWLSWQESPGMPMGLAITKRFLTTDNSNCFFLINWLSKLFKELVNREMAL